VTRSLKIYKPQDIDDLVNIREYKKKARQDCETLVLEVQQKCEVLKKEAYDTSVQQLYQEQLKLLEMCQQKVNRFFKNAQLELNGIVRVLSDKLYMDESMSKTLAHLVFSEVEKLKIRSTKFTVHAHAQVLGEIKKFVEQEYKGENEIMFDFMAKNELRFEECLLESEYVMARISVNDFKEKVLHILTEKLAET
jgi:hypothetical protein